MILFDNWNGVENHITKSFVKFREKKKKVI
jgi:hypothetical protein